MHGDGFGSLYIYYKFDSKIGLGPFIVSLVRAVGNQNGCYTDLLTVLKSPFNMNILKVILRIALLIPDFKQYFKYQIATTVVT